MDSALSCRAPSTWEVRVGIKGLIFVQEINGVLTVCTNKYFFFKTECFAYFFQISGWGTTTKVLHMLKWSVRV